MIFWQKKNTAFASSTVQHCDERILSQHKRRPKAHHKHLGPRERSLIHLYAWWCGAVCCMAMPCQRSPDPREYACVWFVIWAFSELRAQKSEWKIKLTHKTVLTHTQRRTSFPDPDPTVARLQPVEPFLPFALPLARFIVLLCFLCIPHPKKKPSQRDDRLSEKNRSHLPLIFITPSFRCRTPSVLFWCGGFYRHRITFAVGRKTDNKAGGFY